MVKVHVALNLHKTKQRNMKNAVNFNFCSFIGSTAQANNVEAAK